MTGTDVFCDLKKFTTCLLQTYLFHTYTDQNYHIQSAFFTVYTSYAISNSA
jgi:hypothetical protein